MHVIGAATATRPSSRDFESLFSLWMSALPVMVEYLSLSIFAHDVSLVRYLLRFPGSTWPNLHACIGSENLLYLLRSPFTDKVDGGRTINLHRRHIDDFHRIDNAEAVGQIPDYQVIRELVPVGHRADAFYSLVPVVEFPGDITDAVVREKMFEWLGVQVEHSKGLPTFTPAYSQVVEAS